jgi:hypothetical protein
MSSDPRRAHVITTRIRGVADKRRAYLTIDGVRWALVEWGGPGRWCIEDDQGRCLTHAEDTRGTAPTLADAIALAAAMIRDGRMPSPEEAKQLAKERGEKQDQQRDAWQHPERLYEPLADALELWGARDPDFTRSNSYQRLRDELIAIAVGAVGHFEQVRDSALRALHHIEARTRDHWYGEDAEGARAQIADAEEHLERARQIICAHDPDRTPAIPASSAITAEQVIEEARAARTARATRRRREAARDPDGTKRAKRRAMNNWRSNASMVRLYAALMTDEELTWFTTTIAPASQVKGARKNPDDALRLRDLSAALSQRSHEQHRQQFQEERRAHAERLKRLATSVEPQRGETAA